MVKFLLIVCLVFWGFLLGLGIGCIKTLEMFYAALSPEPPHPGDLRRGRYRYHQPRRDRYGRAI